MAQAAKRGWQPGRALTLVAGLVVAGGVLMTATAAQTPKDKPTGTIPIKDKDKPKTGDKTPPEKTQPEKQPGLLKKMVQTGKVVKPPQGVVDNVAAVLMEGRRPPYTFERGAAALARQIVWCDIKNVVRPVKSGLQNER